MTPSTPEPPHNPLWLRFLAILGRAPSGVTRAQMKLLGALGLALLFEHYDAATLANATKFIRESFGVPQSEVGRMLGLVRFGALPAVLLVPFADRVGRRKLFLITVGGASLCTLATAFTQDLTQFVAAQMLVRSCMVAGSASAFVIAAEEFPAQNRGWAIGVLGALAALGYGLSAGVFSLISQLPWGWRALYVPGVLPMLLLPYFGRRVSETERFRAERDRVALQEPDAGFLRPFATLARHYPGRVVAMAGIALFAAMGQATAHGPIADYVQTNRGWNPQQYSAMVIIGGAVGIAGNTVLGRMADQFGRRSLGLFVLVVFPFLAFAVFHLESFFAIGAAWVALVFVTMGGNTLIRALAAELFPTSSRSTAAGSLTLFETVGAAGGLYLVTLLTPAGESIARAVQMIVFVSVIAGGIVLLLPETARRELEDISKA